MPGSYLDLLQRNSAAAIRSVAKLPRTGGEAPQGLGEQSPTKRTQNRRAQVEPPLCIGPQPELISGDIPHPPTGTCRLGPHSLA